MTASSEKYTASDQYLPIVQGQSPEKVLKTLLSWLSPHLEPEVVADAKQRVPQILSIRERLRALFRKALADMNVNGEALAILEDESDLIPEIEAICKKVEPGRRENVREALDKLRNSLDADVLERLGFMPNEISPRGKMETASHKPETASHKPETAPHKTKLLSETFPEWFPTPNGGSAINHIEFGKLSRRKFRNLSSLINRSDWITDAREEIQDCINTAFARISGLRRTLAEGEMSQPYEMHSDLNSKSLVELLEIVINPNLESRRRIDAFFLLRLAIAIFSIRKNPVFQERINVQNAIHQALNIGVWGQSVEIEALPVTITADGRGDRPVYDLARSRQPKHGRVIARRLAENGDGDERNSIPSNAPSLSALLAQYEDILDRTDIVFFGSRSKDEFSIALKILLAQERFRQYAAKIKGMSVPAVKSVEEAQTRLQARQTKMRKYQGDLSVSERPICLESLDDMVGITLSEILARKLNDFPSDERRRVNECLEKVAVRVAELCGLSKISQPENKLWLDDGAHNPRRAGGFREVKIHGVRIRERERWLSGSRRKERVEVPVEIQIPPAEIYMQAKSPGGEVSATEYQDRKARDVRDLVLPGRVGDEIIYPRRADIEGLARTLSDSQG